MRKFKTFNSLDNIESEAWTVAIAARELGDDQTHATAKRVIVAVAERRTPDASDVAIIEGYFT